MALLVLPLLVMSGCNDAPTPTSSPAPPTNEPPRASAAKLAAQDIPNPPANETYDPTAAAARQRAEARKAGAKFQRHHFLDDGVVLTLVFIPPGQFTCSDGTDIHIRQPFWISKHEVTQEQWQALMDFTPFKLRGAEYPATVRGLDAQAFAAKLSKRLGEPVSLPTPAMWEYACRADSTTPYNDGSSDAKSLGRLAWFAQNSGGELHPVGQLQPNAWGLYDMHGNSWEWCHPDAMEDWPSQDKERGKYRSWLFGGSFSLPAERCRSDSKEYRLSCNPMGCPGFRVVAPCQAPAPSSRTKPGTASAHQARP